MKSAPAPDQDRGALERLGQRVNSTAPAEFVGTANPRHLRVLHALLRRSMPREQLDREAGYSNGPDLVSELRERGLDVPCTRVVCFDRDHREVKRGLYHLTARDRARLHRWLAGRG